jgi:hypothetical protein
MKHVGFVNDQGSAMAGFEELGLEVRFDVEMDERTGYPVAENVEAVLAVGPLELNITASKNKGSLNRAIQAFEAPVRNRVEASLIEEINENIDGLTEGLNVELQKHAMQEVQDTVSIGGLQQARAGGAGWGGPPSARRGNGPN